VVLESISRATKRRRACVRRRLRFFVGDGKYGVSSRRNTEGVILHVVPPKGWLPRNEEDRQKLSEGYVWQLTHALYGLMSMNTKSNDSSSKTTAVSALVPGSFVLN